MISMLQQSLGRVSAVASMSLIRGFQLGLPKFLTHGDHVPSKMEGCPVLYIRHLEVPHAARLLDRIPSARYGHSQHSRKGPFLQADSHPLEWPSAARLELPDFG
jgi:hypothetical protein